MDSVPEDTGFAIRTRYEFQREYVVSKTKELSLENYLDECGRTFGFTDTNQHEIEMFFDHTRIYKEDFHFIVKREGNCASFYIHLVTTPKLLNEPVYTLTDFVAFLRRKCADEIIEKGRSENPNIQLTEAERKNVITLAHEYLSEKCSKVERSYMVTVAKLIVFAMPRLRDSTKGDHAGYNVVLDYLAKKFRNANYSKSLHSKKAKPRSSRVHRGSINATHRKSSPVVDISNAENVEPACSPNVNSSDENSVKDLQFLKSVVVSNENMDLIRQKLRSTVVIRSEKMKETKLDFLEQYPIFFTHPTLILDDFVIRFKVKADPNGLIENWPNYSKYVKEIGTNHFKSGIRTEWPVEIESFLLFLKLLPARAGKTVRQGLILPFSQAMDKFFIFSEVKPSQKELDKNIYPHIIAVGSSKENVSQFYIAVENHLIDVPNDWSVAQVVDLFFKIHLNFDIKFEININPIMTFFGHFLYGIKSTEFKTTLTMRNLASKIALAIARV